MPWLYVAAAVDSNDGDEGKSHDNTIAPSSHVLLLSPLVTVYGDEEEEEGESYR